MSTTVPTHTDIWTHLQGAALVLFIILTLACLVVGACEDSRPDHVGDSSNMTRLLAATGKKGVVGTDTLEFKDAA